MTPLFLAPSLSRSAGGIFEIMTSLAVQLRSAGTLVEACGLEDALWPESQANWGGLSAHVFPTKGPRAFGYSPALRQAVMNHEAPLLHLHALWMYPSLLTIQWARAKGKPYMVTPNGMLEPWALANSAWKKKAAAALYENRMLRGAACLQANTLKELSDIRNFGLNNPVAVIPNGVHLPNDCPGTARQASGVKTLLYLGRLHPKKGLDSALRAWKDWQAARQDRNQPAWRWIIAGWDDGGHEASLKQLCRELELPFAEVPARNFHDCSGASGGGPSVVFAGPAFGPVKKALFERADAFILPSHSEGLPMAVLEAWAGGLPVLMTEACNLPEGFAVGAALPIDVSPLGIVRGLKELDGLSDAGRSAMGSRGRALVAERFTWLKVAGEMNAVYRWMISGGNPPSCVHLQPESSN